MSGVALMLNATCRNQSARPPASDAAVVETMPVEWAGCAGIRQGPVCQMGAERRLTLWVDDARKSKWSVEIDRERLAAKTEYDVDGGVRLTVDIPSGSLKIVIRDAGGQPRWSLSLSEAKAHLEIDRLLALGRSGQYEDALKSLERLRTHASDDARGLTDAAIGRMALALGRIEQAEKAFRASIAAAREDGRIADVIRDSSALLWALLQTQQRFAEARALLEQMRSFGEQYPEGRVWLDYHAGMLAADTADVRTALDKYRSSERMARRLALTKLAESATDEVARLLARVGRADEAIALQKSLPAPSDPCARTTRELNLAWALMEQAAKGQHDKPNPQIAATLSNARTALASCPDPLRRRLAIVSAAEYALQIGDDATLNREIQELEALPPDRDVLRESRRADVLGRWYLRQGKASAALAAFQDQIPAALGADLLEEAFRGEVGAGRALLSLGRPRAAVTRLKHARDLLEQMLRGIPLAEGRASFLGGHDDGIRYLVGALVESGEARDALRTCRWARATELRHAARLDRLARLEPGARRRWDETLGQYRRIRGELEHEAQSDWTLPRVELAQRRTQRRVRAEHAHAVLDEAYRLLVEGADSRDFHLVEPKADELFLAFFPGPDRWFGFAATAAGVEVRSISEESFSSTTAAQTVLSLFESRLAGARRVRLFPYGISDTVDWQAVTWRGRPLLSSVEVEYGMDVGIRANAEATSPTPPIALVIANPSSDLPAATSEADAVTQALASWRIIRLDGAAATREATLAALPKAALFHYAGHAWASGPQDLSSALLLNAGARIELGDLLAVASVPELVVLSACEGARTGGDQPSLMGLAQAFVAAGSRATIAATRAIRDTDARIFISRLYPELVQAVALRNRLAKPAPDGSNDFVSAAFRRAAVEVFSQRKTVAEARQDGNGWGGFRLLVP